MNTISARLPSLRKRLALPGLLTLLTLAPAVAQAQIVMNFEGLQDLEAIQNFYNGGTGSFGSSGPNLGVEFLGNTLAIIPTALGGAGNLSNLPSPRTALFFREPATSAVINVSAGLTGGFSFFYSSSTVSSVVVYDGPNATGNVLVTIPINAQSTQGCTGTGYCNWTAAGGSFSGTAYSVDFGGTADRTAYDNITLGSAIPGGATPMTARSVPALGLGGLALLGSLAVALGLRPLYRQRRRSA